MSILSLLNFVHMNLLLIPNKCVPLSLTIMILYSGYMAPEYISDGLFSTKSDVFSFGILVLEIISGKKNRGFLHENYHGVSLIGHVSIINYIGHSRKYSIQSNELILILIFNIGMDIV